MPEQKLSPKLIELCKWKHIQEVNNRLDAGDTPNSVCDFINANGFKISRPLIYDYARMRKKALVDGLNINHMIGVASQPIIDKDDPVTKSTSQKLKSEIDALDMIIQGGYRTLQEWDDRPIAPKTMMEAIKLKNDLTDGNHGFLTNYGMEQLRAIEQNKYQLLIQHLVSYIPEELQQEAIDKMDTIEDEYYQTTDYYEEYIKALDVPEEEKKRRLDLYFNKNQKDPQLQEQEEEGE